MTNRQTKAFLFIKDYANNGQDRYFLFHEKLDEVDQATILDEKSTLICHDSWLIFSTFATSGKFLPQNIIDADDFQAATTGGNFARRAREKQDIGRRLPDFPEKELASHYFKIFNKSAPFDEKIYSAFGAALLDYWKILKQAALEKNELDRYLLIEQPVWNYVARSAAKGISIDVDRLGMHKKKMDHDYYTALKEFSNNYNFPLEIPHDEDVVDYLTSRGFDFSGIDVDYMLRFVPMPDNFAKDLLNLKKLALSRGVLNALPVGQKRAFPMVDTFGSITSRIYYKDPALQNLAKRHRDILVPEVGTEFCYVDYDQYEVGIMTALSGDPAMRRFYLEGDLYEAAAEILFQDALRRKQAKRLFLSYAYGMNFKALIQAAEAEGAPRKAAKDFFRQFSKFEQWKISVHASYLSNNRIGTSLGNYRYRDKPGPLTPKEERSAISQVVQGTASLIFKKALLAVSKFHTTELILPMHDAMLLQVESGFDVSVFPELLGDVMFNHFDGEIIGKVSLDDFAPVS